MGAIENEYVQIHTRDERVYDGTILTSRPSVHVYEDAREYKRDEANMEVRIDELVKLQKRCASTWHPSGGLYFVRSACTSEGKWLCEVASFG